MALLALSKQQANKQTKNAHVLLAHKITSKPIEIECKMLKLDLTHLEWRMGFLVVFSQIFYFYFWLFH